MEELEIRLIHSEFFKKRNGEFLFIHQTGLLFCTIRCAQNGKNNSNNGNYFEVITL